MLSGMLDVDRAATEDQVRVTSTTVSDMTVSAKTINSLTKTDANGKHTPSVSHDGNGLYLQVTEAGQAGSSGSRCMASGATSAWAPWARYRSHRPARRGRTCGHWSHRASIPWSIA